MSESDLTEGGEWLSNLLNEIQLSQFFIKIHNDLQVTRLSHFDFVKVDDLRKIGISMPAIRRLMNAIENYRAAMKKKLSGEEKEKTSTRKDPETLNSPESPEIFINSTIETENIFLVEKIGDGSFSAVWKGEWVTPIGLKKVVAVRLINADFSPPGFFNVLNSLQDLKHTNLIEFFGLVISTPMMMVTELAEMGSLLDILKRKDFVLVTTVCEHIKQLLNGMLYLEDQKIVHKNLALRNLFLINDIIKISDIGLVPKVPAYIDERVNAQLKFAWFPPESLKFHNFSHASDVWMWAITLWEMFTLEEPWKDLNVCQILEKIEVEHLAKPQNCPSDIYLLMTQCWAQLPQNRPSFVTLRDFLSELVPENLSATGSFKEQNSLLIEDGDLITLIERESDCHWWMGQNMRTGQVGRFLKRMVETQKDRPGIDDTVSRSKEPGLFGSLSTIESKLVQVQGKRSNQTEIQAPVKKKKLKLLKEDDDPTEKYIKGVTALFRHLSVEDKINCSQVDSFWNKAFWRPSHWNHLVINVSKVTENSKPKIIQLIISSAKSIEINAKSDAQSFQFKWIESKIFQDILSAVCEKKIHSYKKIKMSQFGHFFDDNTVSNEISVTQKICTIIRAQKKLQIIDLANAKVQVLYGIMLVEAIGRCTSIQVLNLTNLCSNDSSNLLPPLCKTLAQLSNLRTLAVSLRYLNEDILGVLKLQTLRLYVTKYDYSPLTAVSWSSLNERNEGLNVKLYVLDLHEFELTHIRYLKKEMLPKNVHIFTALGNSSTIKLIMTIKIFQTCLCKLEIVQSDSSVWSPRVFETIDQCQELKELKFKISEEMRQNFVDTALQNFSSIRKFKVNNETIRKTHTNFLQTIANFIKPSFM